MSLPENEVRDISTETKQEARKAQRIVSKQREDYFMYHKAKSKHPSFKIGNVPRHFMRVCSLLLTLAFVMTSVWTGSPAPLAAAIDGSDLSYFIDSVVIEDAYGTTIEAGDPVYDGETYAITITFIEGTGEKQFVYNTEGFLTYTLPANLQLLEDITNGEIWLKENQVGSYTATKDDGVFLVTFGEFDQNGDPSPGFNFIDYTDASFVLGLDAKFRAAPGEVELNFGDGQSISFVMSHDEKDITIEKKASNINSSGIITYTVTIEADGYAAAVPPQTITGIVLKDAPYSRTSATSEKSSITTAQETAYGGFKYEIVRASGGMGSEGEDPMAVTWASDVVGTRYGFTYDFDDDDVVLNPGDKIIVTYTLDANIFLAESENTALSGSYYAGNDVAVTADGGLSDEHNNVQTNLPDNSTTVSKSYSTGNSRWTATVGNGTMKLNGQTITDTQTSNNATYPMTFPAESAITVNFYTSPRSFSAPSYHFTADQLITQGSLTLTGDTMTLIVPDAGDSTPTGPPSTFGTIYRVSFVYNTDAPTLPTQAWPTTFSVTHTNKISLGSSSDTATRTFYAGQTGVPGAPTTGTFNISKTSSKPRETVPGSGVFEIDYKVVINVPAGNDGTIFYYRDDLVVLIGGGNTPVNNTPSATPTVTIDGDTTVTPFTYQYNANSGSSSVRRYWYLYFGGSTGMSESTSLWPYSDARTITITYTIAFSRATYNGTPQTILQLLQSDANALLRNTAEIRNGSTVIISDTQDDAWPVHKDAEAVAGDPALYNYTVILNQNELYQLFATGEQAIITDTFDSMLEYVPGSFYVLDRTESPERYYGPVDDTAIVTEHVLQVDLRTLREFDGWPTLTFFPSPQDPVWYTGNHRVEIHYQLRVPDPGSVAIDTPLTNHVTVESTTFDIDFFHDATVRFANQPVTKAMELESGGGRTASVEIIINPNGWKLAPAEIDQFKAVDTMSENLTFYLGTIKVETKTVPGGVWTEQPMTVSDDESQIWTRQNLGPHQVSFIFPDEAPIRITYDAMVLTPAGIKEDVWNKIEVLGYSATKTEGNYEVSGTTGSASARRQDLFLIKQDEDDGQGLEGAEFKLYMATKDNQYYGIGTPTEKVSVGAFDFYLLQTATTGSSGEAQFDSVWLTPTHGAIYMLAETKAPDGYELPGSPGNYTFFYIHSMTPTEKDSKEAALGAELRGIADSIYLNNAKIPNGSLTLNGTKTVNDGAPTTTTFSFTVTEEESLVSTAAVTGSGLFAFERIYYTEAGRHIYVVSEDTPGGRWTRNTMPITVYVDVTDEGGGVLLATAYKDAAFTEEITDMAAYLTFSNTYSRGGGEEPEPEPETGGGGGTTPPGGGGTTPPGGGDENGGGEPTGGGEQTGGGGGEPEIAITPPDVPTGHILVPDGDGFIQLDEDGTPLGRWEWDPELEEWIFDEFVPLGALPPTGDNDVRARLFFLSLLILGCAGMPLMMGVSRRGKHERS